VGANWVPILVLLLSPVPASHWQTWSERGDLNSRPPVPQTGALTELRYAPTLQTKHPDAIETSTNHKLQPDCNPDRNIRHWREPQ
jgi:hypothetical protein